MNTLVSRKRRARRPSQRRHRRYRQDAIPERFEAGEDEPCELIGPGPGDHQIGEQ